MDNRLVVALDERDAQAAQRFIEDESDPARVLAMYHGALRHLYWSNKDIETLVGVGRFALAFGAAVTDEAHLGLVKSIAYDIGSFCWPGWDEPGIEIDDATLAFGADAAVLNLELALRLRRPAGPMANAHWLIGAHHLVTGRTADAVTAFERSRSLADDEATKVLADAYIAIATGERWNDAAFASLEEGEQLVAQLRTAERLYGH